MRSYRTTSLAFSVWLCAVMALACGSGQPKPGTVLDEAMRAKRTAASFPAADEDYFHDMDGGLTLTKERDQGPQHVAGLDRRQRSALGRARPHESLGSLDFLKTVSSHPTLPDYARQPLALPRAWSTSRASRRRPARIPNRYGLWLDVRDPSCPPDPFANARQVPGRRRSARAARTVPVGSYYGEPTGIVGLRLFPNPDFDEKARAETGTRSATTATRATTSRRDLVRPYRVGMSCAFCHVGPNPVKPPADPENPRVGEPQLERRRAVLLVGPRLRLERHDQRGAASSTRRCTPRCRARSTPRSSRPTTSTTRGR